MRGYALGARVTSKMTQWIFIASVIVVLWLLDPGNPVFVKRRFGAFPRTNRSDLHWNVVDLFIIFLCCETSIRMNMNDCDEMSDLSFRENGQKEFSPASEAVRRRFHCKVFGCSKSYSHSSSLYRHVGSAHPIFVSFRNEQTTHCKQFDIAANYDDRLHQIDSQNPVRTGNAVNRRSE